MKLVKMKLKSIIFSCFLMAGPVLQGQSVIPNPGFENWTSFGSYFDPTGWDTPNEELMFIPPLGITVVSQSTDHHGTGNFSVKLETKYFSLFQLDVPGFMTCGKFTVDLVTGTYILSGGVPVTDLPTHLKGFFKFFPMGGDSCVVGIGLTKTTGSIKDTIGLGSFSTKDTITDWTPFSAWIDYINPGVPDSMNIIAMSTAQEIMTIGTTLYIDDLYLDYTVGLDKKDQSAGISVYNDQETRRLMIFIEFTKPVFTRIRLFNMTGQEVSGLDAGLVENDRKTIAYAGLREGIYILEILYDNKIYSKKFFLDQR